MQTNTILLLLIAFLFSLLITYFQYYFGKKKKTNQNLLALLRFISIFLLCILLINPIIKTHKLVVEKPTLNILVDNSESIKIINKQNEVINLVEKIKSNQKLNQKFNVSIFSFGSKFETSSNFKFDDYRTDIYTSIKEINKLSKNKVSPIILITDGNQSFGKDYKYIQSKQKIFPIIIGDTLEDNDLEIKRLNVNKFSFNGNKFPLEVFVSNNNLKSVKTKLNVIKNGRIIQSKIVKFDKKNLKITFSIQSNSIGKQHYKVELIPFKGEKNKINNYKNFNIEVIDEQSKVGLIYGVLHPDIGMIKRSIESNKKRKVDLIAIENNKINISDFDVFILYQPNQKFKQVFLDLISQNKNYLLITGKQTNWSFLNEIQNDFNKNIVQSYEHYYPVFNSNFDLFHVNDIGFDEFSPLDDYYGNIKLKSTVSTILSQNINGVQLNNPLLAVFENQSYKKAFLFGENIWNWRNKSYVKYKSFHQFDQFINSLIQFLSLAHKDNKMRLEYKSFYFANEPIKISAQLFDSNFNFEKNAQLVIKFENENIELPFDSNELNYEITVPELKEGEHKFIVKNLNSSIYEKGTFTMGKYSVEQEFVKSNVKDLNYLAMQSGAQAFFPNKLDSLLAALKSETEFIPIQKEITKKTSLINWKWLLGLIVLSLSTEWFIRKYRGLI